VNDIAASGRHLLALIDDIMDLSAIDQGARQLGSEDVDLVETLGDVVKFTEATRRRRGIRLSVGGGLPTVTGDGRAVRQIVLNLVTNAIKFSPDGAEVTCVGCGDPGDGTAGLKIVDRGIGIEPEDLGKVGTAFFRTQSAIQKAIPGTGLGLSIAFVLAKKMDGNLTIESSVGSGTTATLLLPVRP
jgi:two-component system cell cycle sensor histidine kinase PleC